jgi:hypothetical protein
MSRRRRRSSYQRKKTRRPLQKLKNVFGRQGEWS